MTREQLQARTGSLLDRLIGDTRRRSPAAGGGSDFQESVRRDLENLLNTRWRCMAWPPDLTELEQSLVNYGIPDFTGTSFNDASAQRELRGVLQHAIKHFEPRLRGVRVTVVDRGREDRTLRFRIEAELATGAAGRAVTFETALDPTTSTFRVGRSPR